MSPFEKTIFILLAIAALVVIINSVLYYHGKAQLNNSSHLKYRKIAVFMIRYIIFLPALLFVYAFTHGLVSLVVHLPPRFDLPDGLVIITIFFHGLVGYILSVILHVLSKRWEAIELNRYGVTVTGTIVAVSTEFDNRDWDTYKEIYTKGTLIGTYSYNRQKFKFSIGVSSDRYLTTNMGDTVCLKISTHAPHVHCFIDYLSNSTLIHPERLKYISTYIPVEPSV